MKTREIVQRPIPGSPGILGYYWSDTNKRVTEAELEATEQPTTKTKTKQYGKSLYEIKELGKHLRNNKEYAHIEIVGKANKKRLAQDNVDETTNFDDLFQE